MKEFKSTHPGKPDNQKTSQTEKVRDSDQTYQNFLFSPLRVGTAVAVKPQMPEALTGPVASDVCSLPPRRDSRDP
jgi:hypothetical protein